MSNAISTAPLFVPGNRPDRVRKARTVSDLIIVDLEDAVPPEEKAAARTAAAAVLSEAAPGVQQWVRVNPVGELETLTADLAALAPVAHHLNALVVPKVMAAADLGVFHELTEAVLGTHVQVIASIENAAGVRACWDIAEAQNVVTLLFGTVDLSADLGITTSVEGTELLAARSLVVMACAAAGVATPIDGPFTNIYDNVLLAQSCSHAARLGFGSKIALHPSQLETIRTSFSPAAELVAWAHQVLAAYDDARQRGVGVARLDDGTFIDAPVATRARKVLTAVHDS